MKKVIKTNQPEKVEMNAEMQASQNSFKKAYLPHKPFDHSHGRVNKTPFGINHEPGCF
jgi:hypothetical protein